LKPSRNPYVEGEGPKLRLSAFVFMDVLGYADLIRRAEKNGKQQILLEEIHQALEKGRHWLDNRSDMRFGKKDLYVFKSFTDNIIIAWPIHDDAESELGSLFFKLTYFQFEMAIKGFFVRGAISLGNAYVDDVTVFGDALTEAYFGESSLARDPRIILTASSVAAIKRHLRYYGNSRHAPQVTEILCDADGQWFLNYLDCILAAENEVGPFYAEFLQHKAAVEAKLKEFVSIRLSFPNTLGLRIITIIFVTCTPMISRTSIELNQICLGPNRD
jgi:hypothetical protein